MAAGTVRWFSTVALMVCAALAIPVVEASGAPLASFTALGSGASAGALGSCPTGLCPNSDSCLCVPISGTGKGSSIGNVKFSTTVVLDTSKPIADCNEGLGTLTLTSTAKAANALVMEYEGSICEAGGGFVLNAAFFIDGTLSSGKYAGASGSGNIAGSENATSGAIQGNINGTLLP
jgi:hypothetical protein